MIAGSSNSSYDLYENVTENNHSEVKEHEHENEHEEKSKDEGYTDVYPDDSSENIEMSDVNLENTSTNISNEENKVNYIDLDVTNNKINNITIDSSIEGYCKKKLGKHYRLVIFLIMIELFIFGYLLYQYMTRPRLPVVPRQIVNNLSRLN
tara:strand:+ start:5933 stop:6385 length:453 start_codon:yes stop_codon:yes gene_type:complete